MPRYRSRVRASFPAPFGSLADDYLHEDDVEGIAIGTKVYLAKRQPMRLAFLFPDFFSMILVYRVFCLAGCHAVYPA